LWIAHRVTDAAPTATGVRRLPSRATTRKRLNRNRRLKYIFVQDHDDFIKNMGKNGEREISMYEKLRSKPTSTSAISSSSSSSYMLHDIVHAFRQAVTPKQKNDDTDNVHVGKLLTAVSKMETHMRKVGMTQAANDMKGNHDKVLALYTAAPHDKRDSVRFLLEWELETGIHGDRKSCPVRVKNNSGAMGLFWIGHTVKYQYDLYRLMIEEGMNPIDAATIAFQKDLEPHLPWPASKMAKAMIPRATPSTQLEFFKVLGGYEGDSYGHEEHVGMTQNVKSIMGIWNDLLDNWSSPFAELCLRDI
jgi:hypothetical protein